MSISKIKADRCRGICNPVYDKRFSHDNRDKSKKECKHCHVFVQTDETMCPCCRLKIADARCRSWFLKKNR